MGADKEVGVVEAAHESIVWCLAWHPVGHILTTGSNDHTVKFWSRCIIFFIIKPGIPRFKKLK